MDNDLSYPYESVPLNPVRRDGAESLCVFSASPHADLAFDIKGTSLTLREGVGDQYNGTFFLNIALGSGSLLSFIPCPSSSLWLFSLSICCIVVTGLFSEEGMAYKAVEDVDLGPESDKFYLRANVKALRMAGLLVKMFVWFLKTLILGPLLVFMLKRNNLIHKLVSNAKIEKAPIFVPSHPYEDCAEQQVIEIDSNLSPPEKVRQAVNCIPLADKKLEFCCWVIILLPPDRDGLLKNICFWRDNSKEGQSLVAERLITAVEDSCNAPLKMSFFINHVAENIIRQATESTAVTREVRRTHLSVGWSTNSDEDEVDCLPYSTTGGTKWLHKLRSCKEDACCIESVRPCGAILVVKTNMHELGARTSGINPRYGTARNPYDPNRISGGSSSGLAAAVAAGLCPVAQELMGESSSSKLDCWHGGDPGWLSRGCLPSIGESYSIYAAISGQSVEHISNRKHPKGKIHYPLLQSETLKDIRLAKYGEWFNDYNHEIKTCCTRSLERLDNHCGWKTLEVTIPEIEAMRLAHYKTIASECNTSISSYLEKLKAGDLGWDARVVRSIYHSFSSKEYIKAQKIRNRQLQFHKKILSKVDVIASPTTGVTAYPLLDDAKETGELDYINGASPVRYSLVGNFLGLPAVTVPVGYDKLGLPNGLQFIGRPWSEATLMHIAHAMQAACLSEYKNPKVFYDLLKKE
ncbi:hypothetical protein MLD38_016258 [Melastoma candidum]|uniref:Uncharacterized protein n=1 Tax=Melastoma candidum TaxID=119954 RepID=A0ACB9RSB6_9MYRT|nr:hypothetical protein MLD38_016258 [Melastoma candidum]